MICYFRNLKTVFDKAEIVVTNENKRLIDEIIHKMVGIEHKNCSATWKEVKKRIAEDEKDFVNILKKEMIV